MAEQSHASLIEAWGPTLLVPNQGLSTLCPPFSKDREQTTLPVPQVPLPVFKEM